MQILPHLETPLITFIHVCFAFIFVHNRLGIIIIFISIFYLTLIRYHKYLDKSIKFLSPVLLDSHFQNKPLLIFAFLIPHNYENQQSCVEVLGNKYVVLMSHRKTQLSSRPHQHYSPIPNVFRDLRDKWSSATAAAAGEVTFYH